MRNFLWVITASATLWLGLGTGIANAGVLDGQTVNYQYYFPDLSSPYPSTGNYFVDSSVEVSDVIGLGTLDFNDNGFVVTFTNTGSFGYFESATFNGFVISDVFSTIDAFTSFSLLSNTGLTGNPVLSFDADHLYVNLQGLGITVGELVFTVSAIPEPENYAMLLAGLGLVGFSIRRKST